MQSKAWLGMGDPALSDVEKQIDKALGVEKDHRILQLRKQRRRAIRRALSLEGCLRRLLSTARDGTTEQVQEAVEDANFALNIPLHNALLGESKESFLEKAA